MLSGDSPAEKAINPPWLGSSGNHDHHSAVAPTQAEGCGRYI